MKKISILISLALCSVFLFAKDYQIVNVEYNLNSSSWTFLPTTRKYALENNVEVNKNRKFETKDDLDSYIEDYILRLSNTRAFDKTEVTYTVKETDELNEVTLNVKTTDTVHLLAVPYPKYDSNTGAVLKLKAKDSNFLGTMNTMSADLNLQYDTSDGKNDFAIGVTFTYDYPFMAGPFTSTWVNDYSLSYTFGDSIPEWTAKSGLKFLLPKDRISYVFEAYQSINNNLDYKAYGDNIYMNSYFAFSTPIRLGYMDSFGAITTTPIISFSANWDFDGIDQNNTNLSSPIVKIGNTIGGSRVNWHSNLRTGFGTSFTTQYAYNIQREMHYPSINMEITAFKAFTITDKINFLNRLGICSDLYTFYYFTDRSNKYASSDGESIGSRLRGIRDTQGFANVSNAGYSTTVPAAIILNFDFPYHLFSTNFTKGFLKHFNFDLQINPFIDMAWTYNKATGKYFDWKDGFYAGGFEVLVYPKKWSSFVVRGSIGFDLGRKLFSDKLNTDWRDDVSMREISIGIGLHY